MSFLPYIIVFAILLCCFIFIPRKKSTKKFAIIVLAFALIGEIFIANFNSFHLLFGDYDKSEVNFLSDNVIISGAEYDGELLRLINGGSSAVVEINNINKVVGAVRINCILPENEKDKVGTAYVNVRIDAMDSTNSANYRTNIADGQIIRGQGRTSVIVLNLSGEVKALKVSLTTESGKTFSIESMTLNESVPLYLSPLRLLLLFFSVMAIYALIKFPRIKSPFEAEQKLCRKICLVMTVVIIVGALALSMANHYNNNQGVLSGFNNTSGNQITQEIVDAFEVGQVHLLNEPSKELLELENPYDNSQRNDAGVYYKWDHLLFEGKYYSYYGIAPVLILFLPYHLATDYYFPTMEAVLLFGTVGILFLSLAFLEFVKLFGKKIPLNIIISSLAVILLSCGIFYCFCSPLFYEIAQSSGFMFVCGGFYFLLSSGVIGEGKIIYHKVLLSTFCLAMAVLCRPTLAMYCITSLLFLAFGFIKLRELYKDDKLHIKKAYLKYFSAALLPFVIIGGIQMWYNYARFGSVFDFGIQYSLTINDFTRSQYHTDFVMIGLFNFLLAVPIIKPEFPFAFSNFSKLDVNGYYFIANYNAVGLFFRALPMFGYFGVVGAYKALSKKERQQFLFLLVPTCIIAPLVIIFSIWESGYGVRYCADFAWQLVLGALAIFYIIYNKSSFEIKKLIEKFFVISVAAAIIINFALVYDYINKSGFLADKYFAFARIFEFWL